MTANSNILPKPLSKGDTVAIVAPSGVVDPALVEGGARTLRDWGLQVVVGKHCLDSVYDNCGNSTFAGTVAHRLDDLRWAITDPTVKAVLCARGGYGAVHLLDSLDSDVLRANAKWLIGFSDITALHAAMLKAGVMSMHAHMVRHLTNCPADRSSRLMHDLLLTGNVPVHRAEPSPLNRMGQASGMLVGGNLAVMSALVSTPYDILQPNTLLFIEDIGEEIYRVQRFLHTLRLNGVLKGLRGLIVGEFTNYRHTGREGAEMADMIAAMVADYDYPVAFNFPVGHVEHNEPLIEGAPATLSVGPSGTVLTYDL